MVVAPNLYSSSTVDFPASVRVRIPGAVAVPKLGLPGSSRILNVLHQEINEADIVHLHELWHIPHLLGGLFARVAGRPHIVSPQGALDARSLSHRARLKWIAWHSYQKRLLESAAGIHAVSVHEEEDVRRRDLRAPVRVIPNGVDVRLVQDMIERAEPVERERVRRFAGDRYLLFIGRLDPMKGLDVLLRSFSEVAREFPDVKLVIAGPDPGRLTDVLPNRVRASGLMKRIVCPGFVDGLTKYAYLGNAELFVLPSHHEGMSVAVLEALASGVPVVVSPSCNVPEVQAYGAGFVTPSEVEPLARTIRYVLENDQERDLMAAHALQLAHERFSAEASAERMLHFYEEALS